MNYQEAIAEVQQSRSRYQIIHFVLGQHDTPEMQFYQLCLELQTLSHALQMAEIETRKRELEIKRLLETGDEMDALEAEEKQAGLDHSMVVYNGSKQEMGILVDLFNESQQYTRDEIEHAQPEYWKKRMIRQTNLQIMAGSVGWAQLDSMRQIGLLDEMVAERHEQLEEQAKLELPS
jgi:chemotaxis signal transduction protein